MSAPPLPDFDRTLQLSQGNLGEAELSECHGLLCGLLCCQQADGTAAAAEFPGYCDDCHGSNLLQESV